jgi:hypothetical protein
VSLTESVLYFDKQEISDGQINSHVLHYVKLAEDGLKYLNNKDKQNAMKYLKTIRVTMKEEYKYYTKSKVQSLMWENEKYSKYYHFIQDAFVKQNSPNAYATLSSNLYDVFDYGRWYYRDILKNIK